MFDRFERLTREEECERILDVCGHEHELVARALDVQFSVLHGRAQLLLGIAGVLVSTSVVLMTGKLIVRTLLQHEQLISPLVIGAGGSAILSAAIVVGVVLRIRWTSQLPGHDMRAWVMTALRYRDRKTSAFRLSIAALLVSMALFEAAAVLAWLS